MKSEVKQNKDSRITIRLTRSELQTLETKMTEAGYKSASSFIRDFVASGQVKPKISQDVVQIARELMNLASMINADRPGSELLEKVKYIAQVNLGGVQ
ncbi:ribbon-helix-helix domain-containing protein [Pseudomonas putida]|uniref:ribbon-helix-helix domain-containing protein n=1 Tax=Pseudomonas putida TaxID=303 RepID=UPI00216A26D2|nr:ribbon-helix-helix domain-containing protein [Pseudomonas putida]MCS4061704.1 Arc/MetJ-type ribon-helix-helix transcriptional regulator [Pseudomonas putida]